MSIETLGIRLNAMGGFQQQGRMIEDKLKTLKKALIYSYQAGTAILADGREFRCLMNPNKLKNTYDEKIISIPFKDICVGQMVDGFDENNNPIRYEVMPERKGKTSDGEEETGVTAGDVFEWKENQSFWLIYLQHVEEYAYFRGECRRCYHEIDVNGNKYKVYIKGPDQISIEWHTKKGESWNDLNYQIEMYVTRNAETEEFFHRFTKIKVEGKSYEVQAVDYLSNPGILTIQLKEYYQNTLEDEENETEKPVEVWKIPEETPSEDTQTIEYEVQGETVTLVKEEENEDNPCLIQGPTLVYPYDRARFYLEGEHNGDWKINDNKKVKIINKNSTEIILEIITSRKGNFVLTYIDEDGSAEGLTIEIGSL